MRALQDIDRALELEKKNRIFWRMRGTLLLTRSSAGCEDETL